MVDDLLADADIYLDITVATVDLTSVNKAFESLEDLGNGTLLGFAGAFVDLGAVEELDFGPLATDGKKGDPCYIKLFPQQSNQQA